MNNPLVSIIVPCYNHEKYIEDSIEGILGQDYDNIEVLIGDDCSCDKSFDLILQNKEKLEKRFKNVITIRNENNVGVTKNLNNLIKKSKGEYIKIIASDDILMPSAISKFVQFSIEKNALVTISNGKAIDEDSTIDNIIEIEKIYQDSPCLNSENLLLDLFEINNISAPCAFVNKSVFDNFGLYDEDFLIEDYEFWLRIASSRKDVFRFLDEELIYYRKSKNSMTSLENNSRLENRKIVLHDAEIKILEKYQQEITKQQFAYFYIKKCLNELKFAKANQLTKLQVIAYNELKSFDGWKYEPISLRITNYLRMIKNKPRSNG